MNIQHFYDDVTGTLTYVLWKENQSDAIIIDPVLDYDHISSTYSLDSLDKVLTFLSEKKLNPLMSLETHIHADHLSGSFELKKKFKSLKIGIGKRITEVQEKFKMLYNFENFNTDGLQFDVLLDEKNDFQIGSFSIKTFFTPGHTPACSSYLIEDCLFTGDSLFMPDFGTGRCDFPGGQATELYDSIQTKIYTLSPATRIFVGHDYRPGGRKLMFQTTVEQSLKENIHINEKTSMEDFVRFRMNRDKSLKTPRLLLASLQININAGELPEKEDNGISYLKIPIKCKKT